MRGAALGAALALCLITAASASAAPPTIASTWVTEVTATGANLRTEINPNGISTSYRFEYISDAAFRANLAADPPREGFFGANRAPATKDVGLGSGTAALPVVQHLSGLTPATAYLYRARAANSSEELTIGLAQPLATQESPLDTSLPDGRAWELVSPLDKAGGEIATPGALFGGGHFQAAIGGDAVTYGSATAFAAPLGAPPASQYLSRRSASGWLTENVSPPLDSGAYGDEPDGAPYRLFSPGLDRGLLFGGLSCRGGLPACPSPTPVLPGSGAEPGYSTYYLRRADGGFSSLLTAADLAHTALSPQQFELAFTAATPDLGAVILSSCAALTAGAIELPLGPDGCQPAGRNLYRHSAAGLELLNLLPGASLGAPGAAIAAPIGAVSEDGERVYWTHAGNLYLRDGDASVQVDLQLGGAAGFQAASADGALAYLTKGGHLYRYSASGGDLLDLTPSGGVLGVLGISADGARVYFQDATGLHYWQDGSLALIAPGADASAPAGYPPATGSARVSADGARLLFPSARPLTGHDTDGHSQLFLFGPAAAGGGQPLLCVSCNPTGERSRGPSSIPGALVNGSTTAYRPRALSIGGDRVFYESLDALAPQDTNGVRDVYQWQADGTGSCRRSLGCIRLLSGGRSQWGGRFIDASASGADVFFLTDGSLVANDPGSVDLYDARIGGGFPIPDSPIPCIGDSCQSLPAAPEDPTPGTMITNAGNPRLKIFKPKRKRPRRRRHSWKHHGKKAHQPNKNQQAGGRK